MLAVSTPNFTYFSYNKHKTHTVRLKMCKMVLKELYFSIFASLT